MSDTNEEFRYEISETIRAHAITFPQAEEGSSCVNRAFKAGGKNFAFLGEKDDEVGLRLKLDASVPDVAERAKSQPERFSVGKGGWAMLKFPPDDPPERHDLERWVAESFMLLVPKKVSKLLTPE